jgi:sugar (pentulose or hexulose) kinase
VLVPREHEHVAAGACVQAASVLTGDSASLIAAAWQLGDGVTVAPSTAGADRATEVRAAYDTRRDREA